MFPLFVSGRPVLQMLYDSGLVPKCSIPLLRTHLRSGRTMFAESKKDKEETKLRIAQNPFPH